jgi:hypothetical protein
MKFNLVQAFLQLASPSGVEIFVGTLGAGHLPDNPAHRESRSRQHAISVSE